MDVYIMPTTKKNEDGSKSPGKDKIMASSVDPETGNAKRIDLGVTVKNMDTAVAKLKGLKNAGATMIPNLDDLIIENEEASTFILDAMVQTARVNKANIADPRAKAAARPKGKKVEVAL